MLGPRCMLWAALRTEEGTRGVGVRGSRGAAENVLSQPQELGQAGRRAPKPDRRWGCLKVEPCTKPAESAARWLSVFEFISSWAHFSAF